MMDQQRATMGRLTVRASARSALVGAVAAAGALFVLLGLLPVGSLRAAEAPAAVEAQPATSDDVPDADVPLEDAPAASAARTALAERLAALDPFHAHFSQFVEGARGQVLEESTGEVILSRPSFRWQVDAPYPQIIVADGAEIRIYDPDLEQVIVRSMTAALADTPIALLTQADLVLSDRFEVVKLPAASSAEAEVFLLSPQEPDSLFQEIQLHFVEAGLAQLLIYDHLGQSTTVKFRAIAPSGAIDPAVFSLVLPPGVDVVEG